MSALTFIGALTLASSLGLGVAATAALHVLLRVWPLHNAARARCTLWFGLLLTLLCAPALFGVAAVRPAERLANVTVERQPNAPRAAAPSESVVPFGRPVSALPARETPALAPESRGLGIPATLCAIWAAGFAFSLGRLLLGLLHLRGIVRASKPLERRAVEGRGTVRVVVSHAFTVPVAVGYLRPCIVLPRSVADGGGADLENVLLHELEHIRRFDDVTALVCAAIVGLLWFNPFAHYAFRHVEGEREMACDEAVVSKTGKRAAYAASLWRLATAPAARAGVAPPFGFGSGVVSRVMNLLSERGVQSKRAFWGAIAGAVACLSLVAVLAISGPSYVIAPSTVTNYTSVALAGGRTLVIGGRTARGGAAAFAQLYDARGDRTALIPMPVGVWSSAAAVLRNGDVLVTGGMTPEGATAAAELFDVRHRTFEAVAPMRSARAAHTATLLPDGQVLIASGMGRQNRLVAGTELYDPVRRRFGLTADGAARAFQTAVLIDSGDVLMFGGNNDRGASHCAIIYGSRHHAYREAGRLLRVGKTSLTFRLSNREIVTHHLVLE